MARLQMPSFSHSTDTWGPSIKDGVPFSGLPFVIFNKADPINYVADFTPSFGFRRNKDKDDQKGKGRGGRGRGGRIRVGDEDAVLGDFSDDELQDFHGKVIKTKKYDEHRGRKDWTAHRAKMAEAHDKLHRKERTRLENAPQSKFRPKQAILRKRRRKKIYENPRPAVTSIKKSDSWQLQCDLWFNSMVALEASKVPAFHDGSMAVLTRAGTFHRVRKDFDAIRCRTPAKLARYKFSDYKYQHFDWVSASNDPILLDIAHKDNGKAHNRFWKVFTTDTILALLMSIIRSKYSFDVVITKIGKNIFLDQRNSVNSYWHVDETSQNRPTKKGIMNINKHGALMKEATLINKVLCEQLVSHKLENIVSLEQKHPFQINMAKGGGSGGGGGAGAGAGAASQGQTPRKGGEEAQELASKGFIYKTFDLEGGDDYGYGEDEAKRGSSANKIRVYARCCAHAFDGGSFNGAKHKNKKAVKSNTRNISYLNIYALNQYDYLKSKTVDWNKELDQGMSGIILTEAANNAFKMTRWVLESYLAGCDKMKLGFVTRVKPNNDREHRIVGVKSFPVKDMIAKLKVDLRREWSVFKHMIGIIQKFETDGRYICVRDPLKQVIRFFKCDDNAFGKDDELPSTRHIKAQILPAQAAAQPGAVTTAGNAQANA